MGHNNKITAHDAVMRQVLKAIDAAADDVYALVQIADKNDPGLRDMIHQLITARAYYGDRNAPSVEMVSVSGTSTR